MAMLAVTDDRLRQVDEFAKVEARSREEVVDEAIDMYLRQKSLSPCSVPKQTERWVKIGRIAEENPDLPYNFIEGALEGLGEIERGEVSAFELELR